MPPRAAAAHVACHDSVMASAAHRIDSSTPRSPRSSRITLGASVSFARPLLHTFVATERGRGTKLVGPVSGAARVRAQPVALGQARATTSTPSQLPRALWDLILLRVRHAERASRILGNPLAPSCL